MSMGGGYIEATHGDDWTIAFYTFDLLPNGGAVYTILFERPDTTIQQSGRRHANRPY